MDNGIQNMGDMALTQADTAHLKGKLAANANIDKAAQNFESMFVTQMLQPMFEGIGVDPTFGGGHGEEIMRSFMLQEYGKIVAKSGGFGIAAAVKGELIRMQQTGSSGGSHVIGQ